MKDINLLPQTIKESRLKKEKTKKKYFYMIMVLLFSIIIYSIPNIIFKDYYNKKIVAESEYKKEKSVEEKLNTLKKLRAELENKKQLADSIKSMNIMWSTVLDDVISVLPDGVKLKKIYGDTNNLNIYGYTSNYEKLVTFMEGFKNFQYLFDGNIVYVNYNKELGVYEFSIAFKMKWQYK